MPSRTLALPPPPCHTTHTHTHTVGPQPPHPHPPTPTHHKPVQVRAQLAAALRENGELEERLLQVAFESLSPTSEGAAAFSPPRGGIPLGEHQDLQRLAAATSPARKARRRRCRLAAGFVAATRQAASFQPLRCSCRKGGVVVACMLSGNAAKVEGARAGARVCVATMCASLDACPVMPAGAV
jgi:hypothetical protein